MPARAHREICFYFHVDTCHPFELSFYDIPRHAKFLITYSCLIPRSNVMITQIDIANENKYENRLAAHCSAASIGFKSCPFNVVY